MREGLVYFPYGVLTSVAAILPVLILIDAGGSAFQVGLIAALASFCNLLAGFFWPKYLRASNKASIVVMGYLGLFLGLFSMQRPSMIFVATAIVNFFPRAIFYAVMSHLKSRTDALSGTLGKFYKFASFASLVGYIIGAVGTHFITSTALANILAFTALISIPIIAGTLSEESLGRLMGNGIGEFRRIGSSLTRKGLGLGKFDFGLDKLPFLATSAFFSLCFGIVFSQRANFVKNWLASDFAVYALVLLELVFSIVIYELAGKADQKGLWIAHILLLLCLGSFLGAIHFLALPWILLSYVFVGLFWPFLNIFYNSYGLGFSEELLGANMSTRSTFYMVGSLLGGFLVENNGFFVAYLIAGAFALLAPVPFAVGQRIINKNIKANSEV